MQDSSLFLQELWPYFLVFARMGGAFSTIPGFSESYVSPRIRLLIALSMTISVTPIVSSSLVGATIGSYHALLLILGEVVVGLFLGLIAKLVMSALDIAGSVIGFQISLANAFVFNPNLGQQTNLVGSFLMATAVVMIFVMDLHYFILDGIVKSYEVISPGHIPPFESMSKTMVDMAGKAFLVGAKLSAPFIILGTTIIIALGLLNRLMPQVQIYFISQPFVIGVGFLVLALTLSALMRMFMDFAEDSFMLLGGGR